jgi:hypothetical protein
MSTCPQKTNNNYSNTCYPAFNKYGAGQMAASPPSNGANDGRPKGCAGNVSNAGDFAGEKSGTLTTFRRGAPNQSC